MRHPNLNAALALVVLFALASTSVHGASVRGEANASASRAAAEGTAAQSAQQEGAIDYNAPQNAARRPRVGSFLARAIEAARRMLNPAVANEEHIADASLFIRKTLKESRFFLVAEESTALERDVKDLITYGTDYVEVKRTYALVDELSKTDEVALHALLLLANYRSVFWLKVDKPEFIAAIKRIERRLHETGVTSISDDEVNWQIDRGFAAAILAAPGSRVLLHKLAKSEVRK